MQGLYLQPEQVGEVYLKLRMQGGMLSQMASEIIKRDFTAVAAGSSSVPKQRFPELLELHLARKPTPAEAALLTLRFGETGVQLDNWRQWIQSDKPVVAAPSAGRNH